MTPIYHITHVDNLPTIISQGLLCEHRMRDRDTEPIGIGYRDLKARRARRAVPCAAGGTLADYVPFYFAPRSPMLYAISSGSVPEAVGCQQEIVHLVSSCEAVAAAGLTYAFTDAHAIVEFSNFYDDLLHLDKIDWEVMKNRLWGVGDPTGERKRRRQAEFLVHGGIPWDLVSHIGAAKPSILLRLNGLLTAADHRPGISVKRGWYYWGKEG